MFLSFGLPVDYDYELGIFGVFWEYSRMMFDQCWLADTSCYRIVLVMP